MVTGTSRVIANHLHFAMNLMVILLPVTSVLSKIENLDACCRKDPSTEKKILSTGILIKIS